MSGQRTIRLDTAKSSSADALTDELEDARSVLFGDEHGTRGNQFPTVGNDPVEVVLGEEHDREVTLQVRLLVRRERNLVSTDCVEYLWADSECRVSDPAE